MMPSSAVSRRPLPPCFALVCAAALLQATGPAAAEPVEAYRWVDESGVVHYSQWPPAAPVATVSTLTLPSTNAEDYEPDRDRYSVLNQADRIGAAWDALRQEKEAEQAERRLARAEARLAELEARAAAPEPAYRPAYFSPFRSLQHFRPFHFGRFHGRFPHRLPRHRPAGGAEADRPAAGPRPGFGSVPAPRTAARPGFGAGGSR